jgi:hypothetical protein
MKEDYNPKLDYQFCKNLLIGNTNDNETRLREVYFGKSKPATETERKILIYKEALEYIKSNIKLDISNSLIKAYEILFNLTISKVKLEKILSLFTYKNNELLYQRLIEEDLFSDDFDFVAYVYNAKRLLNNEYPIIFYKEASELLIAYYKVGETNIALDIFQKIKRQTEVQNIKHKLIHLDIGVTTMMLKQVYTT